MTENNLLNIPGITVYRKTLGDNLKFQGKDLYGKGTRAEVSISPIHLSCLSEEKQQKLKEAIKEILLIN